MHSCLFLYPSCEKRWDFDTKFPLYFILSRFNLSLYQNSAKLVPRHKRENVTNRQSYIALLMLIWVEGVEACTMARITYTMCFDLFSKILAHLN